MNQLTSQQRKLVYMAGIVVLMIPIVWLGLPASASPDDLQGRLAEIRTEEDLGEATFGNVDPASSTMSLVLFGFRGIAASVLWYQADELKSQKNWSELERTAESIVLLQPHYWNVWDQQAWNLAYNVSAEFDDVRDRFFWVKQGAKFLQRGVERNEKIPELYHYMGEFVGRKIGYSDEKDLFRQFFMSDPDERFDRDGEPDNDGKPEDDWMDNTADPEINPNGEDNYLRAKHWYQLANDVLMTEADGEQHKMADILFRAAPFKSTMEYARARSREGKFDDTTREAWEQAYNEWMNEYGKMKFSNPGGWIMLNATREELEKLSQDDGHPIEEKLEWQAREQDLTNYRYWATLCRVEQLPEMVEARRNIHRGRMAWLDIGDAVEAQQHLLLGMEQFEKVITGYEDGFLLEQDEGLEFIEDAIDAVLLFRNINAGRPLPDDYPLQDIFESEEEKFVGIRKEREDRFAREVLSR
jgi:hypothetical protein